MRRLALGDVGCAVLAPVAGLVSRWGLPDEDATAPQGAALFLAFSLPVIWPLLMLLARTYEQRSLFIGAEEFRRITGAAICLLALVGTCSWALKLDVARGFAVISLPLVTVLTLWHRFLQRRWLRRKQRAGHHQVAVLLVGPAAMVGALGELIMRRADQRQRVVGWCSAGPDVAQPGNIGLPLLGTSCDVPRLVRHHGIDAVVAVSSPHLTGEALRSLGWALESSQANLFLAPSLAEVVGPRVSIRPAFGLPLMQVERAELTGHRRVLKRVFDVVVAGGLVAAFSPVLLALALVVKGTSRGPVFYLHERVGQHGRRFRCVKFRSMYVGADRRLDQLLDQSDGNAVQFKMRRDPRITPVGRLLRRFSLDELPQLFNVLAGSMSLVGPRPHIGREVEQYGDDMRRRLLVKPGMTGLWQVSGRSDLSWEDSVRMDVRYVEHWSLSFDLVIMLKTARAVLRGSGAY